MTTTTAAPLLRTPDDYHVIRPEDFGAPGLSARESVGPFVDIQALGTLVTVHDSRFEANRGIGHHPHRGLERLFYILEGTVDHDDTLNGITGHMGTGDLGILTEGYRGMVHSEWNNSAGPGRAYIFVYPTDPTPPTAAFDAIRDEEARRWNPADGVVAKHVVTRRSERLNGDFRELTDTAAEAGAAYSVTFDADEAGLLFVVDGAVELTVEGGGGPIDVPGEHTLLLPPVPEVRTAKVRATENARVLNAVTGYGFGLRWR